MQALPQITISPTSTLKNSIYVFHNIQFLPENLTHLSILQEYSKIDRGFFQQPILHNLKDGKRLVTSPTGPLNRDYDDVRRYGESVVKGVNRLIGSVGKDYGLEFSLFVQRPPKESINDIYINYIEVTVLAILAALHDPLEARELRGITGNVKHIELVLENSNAVSLPGVTAVEIGRRLARDVGESDPERMTAKKCADYIKSFFGAKKNVRVEVIDDYDVLQKEYPLLAAVGRASLHVPRHAPCVVKIHYKSPNQDQVKENLFLVGKGITYDTGGADVKVGGAMTGMSRDKCGAAAVAGFLAVLAELEVKHLNATASLAFVRNSVGSDSYVSDELIKARSGKIIRVGNSDAEGRMVMADLLCELKENALKVSNPRLFTCATLTGHVIRAYGSYIGAMANKSGLGISQRVKAAGEVFGDPVEISTIRREDYEFVLSRCSRFDVIQANNLPSTMTNRGHQYPFAFLILASGVEESNVPYVHLDIAGSAEAKGEGTLPLGRATGSPIPALFGAFTWTRPSKL
jgi:leucyl aminopeptidase